MGIQMNGIFSIKDVPVSWIYKHWCKKYGKPIVQPFDGRTLKINSFWTEEKTPSFCIYYDSNSETYKWKDFSSSKSGDAIELVKILENIPFHAAVNQIIHAYKHFTQNGGTVEEYDVDVFMSNSIEVSVTDRPFTRTDIDFYDQWGISLKTLNKYNVKPFNTLKIKKGYMERTFDQSYGFVYYKADGTPYQVYQPHNEKAKYLSLSMTDYIIGEDQLTFKKKACGILSGLKDIMAMDELELNSDYVAPRSESIILSANEINFLKSKYPYLFCMLDNDKTGLKYMKLYESLYGIPYIKTGLSKDIAMDRKSYPMSELKNAYVGLINSKINISL